MTNVNGHAAVSALQLRPPAKRADLWQQDLLRQARLMRQESGKARKRGRQTSSVVAEHPALKLVDMTVDLDPPSPLLAGKPKTAEGVSKRKRQPQPAPPARPESKPEPAPGQPPKARKKPVTGPHKPALPDNPEGAAASGKRKPGRKPQPVTVPDTGTKKDTVLALLRRPNGASLAELIQATGWQSHYADVRIMPTCVGSPACGAVIAAMESA